VLVPLPIGIAWKFLASINSQFWGNLACVLIVFLPYIMIGVWCIQEDKGGREAEKRCQEVKKRCLTLYEVPLEFENDYLEAEL
jgi:ABC-type transport system involved in Fe-S cluster assembly fused permease/ATPase subunit